MWYGSGDIIIPNYPCAPKTVKYGSLYGLIANGDITSSSEEFQKAKKNKSLIHCTWKLPLVIVVGLKVKVDKHASKPRAVPVT